ncbi:GNAT family N-acetyltransferase [Aneurinibacillus sp. Ricciae_BoGa-3]|uniref:GNAT family N-acetyltransferase n=1 Tax=Aneurinibacillus sp. Ricciae_BoGa-3 TaxID=3022697 RepID=UPI00234032F2|nr:GNAT family N-acyltransferase [Aneurinibacillus sp. Ricciae_BoGa-3]WCK54880.1 GNAT family N-acetyltransferase [Aneurinibacillus sp. Ricciae_BoGa-3]
MSVLQLKERVETMSQSAEHAKTSTSSLSVKFAETANELEQAFRLRYKVFVEEAANLSLANESAVEQDAYDTYCDHLIVTDLDSDKVVGTYRLLPGERAVQNIGFYSETEFDLSGFQHHKPYTLELGRSCVDPSYRDGKAIQMLWKGIADYIKQHPFRYLIGCASLHAMPPEQLNELYSLLKHKGIITDRFGILPRETHRIHNLQVIETQYKEKEVYRRLPPLMKGYQWLGAEIAGEPVYDPTFHTVDFFIILDPAKITRRYQKHYQI